MMELAMLAGDELKVKTAVIYIVTISGDATLM